MLIFLPLDTEPAPLPGGALQISGSLTAASGAASDRRHPVEPAALRKAADAFRAGPSGLSQMFGAGSVGGVDDLVIGTDGAVHVTATVTDATTIAKVSRGVLKAVAIAVRVLGRDPTDPNVIAKAEMIAIALVDRPDDGFARLAKSAGSSAHDAAATTLAALDTRVLELSAELWGLNARLGLHERPARR